MNLVIDNHTYQYETEKMLRVFFPSTKIAVTTTRNNETDFVLTALYQTQNTCVLRVSYDLLSRQKEHRKCLFPDAALMIRRTIFMSVGSCRYCMI